MQVAKQRKLEIFLDKHTPLFIKNLLSKFLACLPIKIRSWILRNKMKTIYGYFIIRGLFLRPSMWALYALIWGYLIQS